MRDGALLELLIGTTSLAIGALIGSTGIGGVLLAPALDVLSNTHVHNAVPICMLAFVFSGLVGTAMYAKREAVRWTSLVSLSIGACPAAFAGAAAVPYIPAALLKLAIATMVIAAGIQALSRPRDSAPHAYCLQRGKLIALGAIVGFGSSLTGTGGPLILLPILLFTGANLRQSVGLSQAIQIPIGVFATANNLIYGRIDLSLGAWVTVFVVVGVYVGSHFAHCWSASVVKTWIGTTLVAAGLFYAAMTLVA